MSRREYNKTENAYMARILLVSENLYVFSGGGGGAVFGMGFSFFCVCQYPVCTARRCRNYPGENSWLLPCVLIRIQRIIQLEIFSSECFIFILYARISLVLYERSDWIHQSVSICGLLSFMRIDRKNYFLHYLSIWAKLNVNLGSAIQVTLNPEKTFCFVHYFHYGEKFKLPQIRQ